MFTHYRRSLIEMCQNVHDLERKPLYQKVSNDLCLDIQIRLLQKIIYIEKRISHNRGILKELNLKLKLKKDVPLSKTQASGLKNEIFSLNGLIDEYQYLLLTFRTIGDALAFTYLDKWDIKSQAFKNSPGFISGKVGLTNELKIFRLAFSVGGVALLNDLTNCLRYGDVSVVNNQRSLMIEVKSGHNKNARILKQITDLESLRDYLNTGRSDKEHGYQGDEVERSLIHSPEINHIERLNTIIERAASRPEGFCLEQVEPGLYYGVAYFVSENFGNAIANITGINNANKYIICDVNELKQKGIGYYPFSLSIFNPNAWYSFYAGDLVIVILASFEVIQHRIKSYGGSLKFDLQKDFALEITDMGGTGKHLISKHFLGRLFHEFISLEWLLDEIIYRWGPPNSNRLPKL